MAARRKVKNIVWKRGTLEHVPIDDATVDVAMFSQALHHAERPEAAIAEARRILRPGGQLLILDLRELHEGWVQAALGDRWLGFKDDGLQQLLESGGFGDVTIRVGAKRAGDPLPS
jgi:ArsR family transcriptional regulator